MAARLEDTMKLRKCLEYIRSLLDAIQYPRIYLVVIVARAFDFLLGLEGRAESSVAE